MGKGKIIIISGPSGSGKTTLHKKILESENLKGKLVKSISTTTRLRRVGEKNGRDYLFISPKQFLYKIKAGHFLEWQQVFDNYYGTPQKCVQDLLKSGKNVLLCIDVKGAAVVSQRYPKAIKVFIKVPSLAILKKRLMARGSETAADLKIRLETARKELLEAKKYDYVLVNNQLEHAFKKLESIIQNELGK